MRVNGHGATIRAVRAASFSRVPPARIRKPILPVKFVSFAAAALAAVTLGAAPRPVPLIVYSAPAGNRPAGADPIAPATSILPNGRIASPDGRSIVVGTNPLGVALTPDGRFAIVSNGGGGIAGAAAAATAATAPVPGLLAGGRQRADDDPRKRLSRSVVGLFQRRGGDARSGRPVAHDRARVGRRARCGAGLRPRCERHAPTRTQRHCARCIHSPRLSGGHRARAGRPHRLRGRQLRQRRFGDRRGGTRGAAHHPGRRLSARRRRRGRPRSRSAPAASQPTRRSIRRWRSRGSHRRPSIRSSHRRSSSSGHPPDRPIPRRCRWIPHRTEV